MISRDAFSSTVSDPPHVSVHRRHLPCDERTRSVCSDLLAILLDCSPCRVFAILLPRFLPGPPENGTPRLKFVKPSLWFIGNNVFLLVLKIFLCLQTLFCVTVGLLLARIGTYLLFSLAIHWVYCVLNNVPTNIRIIFISYS